MADSTPYEGGSFRLKLVLGADFPSAAPRGGEPPHPPNIPHSGQISAPNAPCLDCDTVCPGYFLTKIFHPNIAPNGDICVNTLKVWYRPRARSIVCSTDPEAGCCLQRDWKPDTSLKKILMVLPHPTLNAPT